jgi:hypothetical protein
VNVITPKPRKAKKVSATLDTMCWTSGYFEGASSEGSMFAIVTTANTQRIPTTTKTIALCSRATTVDPAMFTPVITITTAAANTVAHTVESSVKIEDA